MLYSGSDVRLSPPLPAASLPAAPSPRGLAPVNAHKASRLGVACVILAAIGFSAKSILIKLVYAYPVDSTTLITLRMAFSVPFFLALALWRRVRMRDAPLTPRQWTILALTGFLGYYLAALLDMVGLKYISASFERLLLFLYPTMVALLSAAFLGRRVTRRQLFAMGLSYAGILLVFAQSVAMPGSRADLFLGSALVLGSGLVYSVYLIISGEAVGAIGSVRFTAYASIMATLVTFAHFLATHRLSALALPSRVYQIVLVIALMSTVLPTMLMSEGLRRVGANRAAMIGSVGPVVTIFLGVVFLDEQITVLQTIGATLVLVGVTLVSTPGAGNASGPRAHAGHG